MLRTELKIVELKIVKQYIIHYYFKDEDVATRYVIMKYYEQLHLMTTLLKRKFLRDVRASCNCVQIIKKCFCAYE